MCGLAEGGGELTLYPQQAVTALLPGDFDTEDREVIVTVYEEKLRAPLEAGTVLGEAKILLNGDDYGTVRLVNRTTVDLAKAFSSANLADEKRPLEAFLSLS